MYAFIGDVHSQLTPLQMALEHCKQRELIPILLGDLFDARTGQSDSVGVFNLVRYAQEEMGAIALRSNHQNKFERHIKWTLGLGNNVFLSNSLKRTIADFQDANIELKDVLEWMETFPYGVVFRDSRGKEYRCAHALFPREIILSPYKGVHKIMSTTRKSRDLMIYGPSEGKDEKGKHNRIQWWNKPSERDWVRVAGHYHTVFLSDHSLVLDGGMGGSEDDTDNPGADHGGDHLCLWEVESKQLHNFA